MSPHRRLWKISFFVAVVVTLSLVGFTAYQFLTGTISRALQWVLATGLISGALYALEIQLLYRARKAELQDPNYPGTIHVPKKPPPPPV